MNKKGRRLSSLLQYLGDWLLACNSWSSEFDHLESHFMSDDAFFAYEFDSHENVTMWSIFSTRTKYYLDLAASPAQILDTNRRRRIEYQSWVENPHWVLSFGDREYCVKDWKR